MIAKILKLDIAGRPISWISRERGALHYCRDQVDLLNDVPALTNKRLFKRDNNMCMYCGDYLYDCELTRDHVVPVSRGGKDRWENVVTACRECNHRKAAMRLKEIERFGMRLLAVPYVPNRAEGLILANREILSDQMAFLNQHASYRATPRAFVN